MGTFKFMSPDANYDPIIVSQLPLHQFVGYDHLKILISDNIEVEQISKAKWCFPFLSGESFISGS